ncbi:MAG TPA: transposase family protein [Blastocatellia bacterium]|nr:transposase family protein [Blastocatellia bacterium]
MKYNTAGLELDALDDAFFFAVGSLYEHLQNLNDRLDPHGIRYALAVALVFIILAKLAGEQVPREIAQRVELRKELLQQALHFDRDTVPHPITYSRILGKAVDIEREVEKLTSGKKRNEVSYGVTSLSYKQANALKLLEIVQKH